MRRYKGGGGTPQKQEVFLQNFQRLHSLILIGFCKGLSHQAYSNTLHMAE